MRLLLYLGVVLFGFVVVVGFGFVGLVFVCGFCYVIALIVVCWRGALFVGAGFVCCL